MFTGKRTSVIIDTDPGVDDVLLALVSPELEILAFIVSFGNTDIEAAYLNVFKIYQAIALHLEQHPEDNDRFSTFLSSKPFITRGARGPLGGVVHDAKFFHGQDGMGDIADRHPELNVKTPAEEFVNHTQLRVVDKPGAELALDLIRTHPPRSITYIILGPLTTLAQTARLDPKTLKDRIGRVVCMGGALDVPGNTNPVAEFNFFADPYAVKELLLPSDPSLGIPLNRFILHPLDITTPHELPFPHYKTHVDPSFESANAPSVAAGKPHFTHFTSSFLERTRDVMLGYGNDAMELHDIVAVWCAIENPPVLDEEIGALPALRQGWKARQRVFDIERTGEITRGMLVVLDRPKKLGAYATGESSSKLQEGLERHRPTDEGLKSRVVPAQVQVEDKEGTQKSGQGVACVTQTPGPDVLLDLLLKRVWGISVNI